MGHRLVDPDGRDFIIKGVNDRGIKANWPGDALGDLPDMAERWGFNLIRLRCRVTDQWSGGINLSANAPYQTPADLQPLIDACSARQVVVLLEYHDHTGGYYEGAELDALKQTYRELCDLYGDNPYVWYNVMNEPGTATLDTNKWLSVHREVIKVIRDEKGVLAPIVCDGSAWGQDVGEWNILNVKTEKSAILSLADDVIQFDGKEYDNILFSFHAYDQWDRGSAGEATAKMMDFVERIHANGHCVIIGEYGSAVNDDRGTHFPFAIAAVEAVCQNLGVGRIAWSWWGGDEFDLSTSGNGGLPFAQYDLAGTPTNLTVFGQFVWNDLSYQPTYNTWATGYMGLVGMQAEPGTISAGDGVPNAVKYALGYPAQIPLLKSPMLIGNREIRFPVRRGSAESDYHLQVSTNLVDWVEGAVSNDTEVTHADWIWKFHPVTFSEMFHRRYVQLLISNEHHTNSIEAVSE